MFGVSWHDLWFIEGSFLNLARGLILRLINDCDVLFSAMPHTYSQSIIKSVSENLVVLDLSADFRLSNGKLWQETYDSKHRADDLLPQAIYGLPEYSAEKIKAANLVAVPGCYPTSIFYLYTLNIDYISCSPFRIPAARLAAAQSETK